MTLVLAVVVVCGGADGHRPVIRVQPAFHQALAWFRAAAPVERIGWGGLAAGALLTCGVTLERLARLRRRRVVPPGFEARLLERLHEGKLDRQKAVDLCTLNPSPAARLALAAVNRWGHSAAELQQGLTRAARVEAALLGARLTTLRRIAELAPLLGLAGTLGALERVLSTHAGTIAPGAWGTILSPLMVGVLLAALALVAYDGLVVRLEVLLEALARFETRLADAFLAAPLPEGLVARRSHMRVEPAGPHRMPPRARSLEAAGPPTSEHGHGPT